MCHVEGFFSVHDVPIGARLSPVSRKCVSLLSGRVPLLCTMGSSCPPYFVFRYNMQHVFQAVMRSCLSRQCLPRICTFPGIPPFYAERHNPEGFFDRGSSPLLVILRGLQRASSCAEYGFSSPLQCVFIANIPA